MSIIKISFLVLVVAGFTTLLSSCSKDSAAVDKTCKVSFILNSTNAGNDTTVVTANAGELIKGAPTPSRTGFKFDGWYANSADANPDPTKNTAPAKFPAYDIAQKPIYLNAILYARWIP